ncbi:MAG: sulfatase-like hydrolase/transferase [Planctomycetes bacterium]|nr:sulfatase-like hydrolase/transferase [Planctomycetota bacterium]
MRTHLLAAATALLLTAASLAAQSTAASSAVSAAVSSAPDPQRDPTRRPNVLLLFADDQRPDTIGALGNPYVRTPTLDALAARGTAFTDCHCMGSRHGAVCVPSRAMLHSGRALPQVRDDLDGATTLGQVLRAAGYATFATGKWHNGKPSFERSFAEGRSILFGGMSDHNAVPISDLDLAQRTFSAPRAGDRHSSELFADAAIQWLGEHANRQGERQQPFFCYVAFTAPHDPRDAPIAYRERAYANRPPLPPNFRSQHGYNIDPNTLTVRDEQLAAWPRDPEVVRDQLAEYYALIEHLDDQIARILARLDELGLADDTLIVYAADHGLALGSHGLLGKQSLYEHSMGCPLLLAGPGVPRGARRDALVYLLDLLPTLCAATGATVPDGVFGSNLWPVIRGDTAGVRDTLFTLYAANQRAVRDERFKLLRFTRTGKTLLFDLASDPHETRDLAEDPEQAARVAAMLAELSAWQQRVGDDCPLWPADPLPWTIDLRGHARSPDRWQPAWIVEKYFR